MARRATHLKMTAKQAVSAVVATYEAKDRPNRAPRWVCFPEFRVGTGYGSRRHAASPEQRIDLFAMSCYPSDMFERHSYEVKVSRSDWLQELKDPFKRMAAFRMCNRFYFAVPAGLVDEDEVPDGCGLVEVGRLTDHKHDPLVARVVLPAPFHESDPPTWMTVAAMARRSA